MRRSGFNASQKAERRGSNSVLGTGLLDNYSRFSCEVTQNQ